MTESIVQGVVLWLTIGIAVYSALINLSFVLLTGLAMGDLAGYRRRLEYAGYDRWFLDPHARGVSVLMPAYNESPTIVQSVQAMISLRYPDFEVVVIDDGSSDDTREKLIREFDMAPVPLVPSGHIPLRGVVDQTYVSRRGAHNLALVAKSNGGKADALNAGINYSRKELVCMVDADSLLDPQALLNVARPFADNPGRVVAAGGVVRVANGSRVERGRVTSLRMPRAWLSRIAVVEYLRAFLIGRSGWSQIGGLLIISGAFGVFRKDVLQAVEGMSVNSIGEDAELVVRIHRLLGDEGREGEVVFVPEPVAWTEVPESRAVLRKQRRRWHRGLAEIFQRHRSMMFRPRYGVIGNLTMPWFFVFELLAPVVEVLGLLWFFVLVGLLLTEGWVPQLEGLVDPGIVVLLLSASVLFAIFVTLVALLAEELSFRRYRGLPDLLRAVWAAVEENLGYRQLNAWWRLGGLVEAVRGTRHDWGEMTRRGFDQEEGPVGVVSVSAEQVREAVPMPDAVAAVRRAFVDLAAGRFEMPTRTALRDGRFLDMACHHRPSGTAVFKLLSLNFEGRDPAILGSVVWSDVGSTAQLVADAATVTTLRTGAVSGVATDLLAPSDVRRLVVVGTGAQAPDQVRAVLAVRPLEQVTLVGRDRGRADAVAAALADELGGVHVEATDDLETALASAEVVCCATTATEPLFPLGALPAQVHVNAIGSYRPDMRELPDELLVEGLLVVDERQAILEEAGEVLHAVEAGLLAVDDVVELGVALTGGVERTPRTTFKSVGVAAQDWAIGRLLADALLG